MAFKMKRTPMLKKGGLSEFFSGLGKQLRKNRKGVDKAYAEKKSRKPGESKFQADVRRKKEERRAEKKSIRLADEKYGESGIEIKG